MTASLMRVGHVTPIVQMLELAHSAVMDSECPELRRVTMVSRTPAAAATKTARMLARFQPAVMVSFAQKRETATTVSPMPADLAMRPVRTSAGATCGDGEFFCPELEACDDGFTDACGT